MINECKIVHDLLPLYIEDMVTEETANFIKEHLTTCETCLAEFNALKANDNFDFENYQQRKQDIDALISLKKHLKKRRNKIIKIVISIVIIIGILLYIFPFYHIPKINYKDAGFYTKEEIAQAAYRGSIGDRLEAKKIIQLAEKAFQDHTHTAKECEKLYGLLSQYSFPIDEYPDVDRIHYDLRLWSAHLKETTGNIWVYYSRSGLDNDLNDTVSGSSNCTSLWKVKKDKKGEWKVVEIVEGP